MEGDARRKYIHRHHNLPHQTFYDMCNEIDQLTKQVKEMTEERDELMGHIESLRSSL